MSSANSSNLDRLNKHHGAMKITGGVGSFPSDTSGTYQEVPGFSVKKVSGMTFSANGIFCTRAGDYSVDWSAACDSSSTNKYFRFGFAIDDTVDEDTASHRKYATNDLGSTSTPMTVTLAVGEKLTLKAKAVLEDGSLDNTTNLNTLTLRDIRAVALEVDNV